MVHLLEQSFTLPHFHDQNVIKLILKVGVDGPANKSFVLIAYAQMPSLNDQADLFSGASCLIICLSLHLLICFMYARSEGSC